MAALETVDIPAVEILASGGPVHAVGSPPQGDFYTRDELVAIADAHHELGEEIRAPIKIGHSDRQQLAANSGLTAGEMPALGWLDPTSFRVEDDPDTGVAKLVADAKAVPAKLADLMRAGAYRTRSSEIRRYASQKTQKTYDWVVDGLALLGEKVPAIQTLDDVYRLYERAGIDRPEADTFVVRREHAAAEIIWQPESSYEDLRDDLNELLNPGGPPTRFWVSDINLDRTACVVRAYDSDDTWVVPITVDDQGTPAVASASQWQAAADALVAETTDLERRNRRAAESRSSMADEQTISLEEIAPLAENLGVEGDVTVEALTAAAEARANELAERDEKIADLEQKLSERKNEASDADRRLNELETRVETAEKRAFEMERDTDLEAAVRQGKIDPADLDEWAKDYEDNQAATRRVLERLKPDPTLVRELGRDDAETPELEEQQLSDDFERRFGQRDPLKRSAV